MNAKPKPYVYEHCYACRTKLEKPVKTTEELVTNWQELHKFLNDHRAMSKWRISGFIEDTGTDGKTRLKILVTSETVRRNK